MTVNPHPPSHEPPPNSPSAGLRNESPAPGGGEPVRFFRPQAPALAAERVLRIQGYADPTRVRPAIARAAAEMVRVAQDRSKPEVAYRYCAVRGIDAQGVALDHGIRLGSAAFESRLWGCTQVVPFLLSCGEPLGRAVVDLAEAGDLMEAVLLEAAGWLCVEDATRQFKEELRRQVAERGGRITSRMGPGYTYRVGDADVEWPLEDNPRLFALLDGAALPVKLMPSCAMYPKLSRSGLFGVAPARPVQPQAVLA